jgi:hypothetical protein
VLAVLSLGASMTACSDGGTAVGDTTSTSTTTTVILVGCTDASTTDPVLLEEAPGMSSVVDVVTRPSGELVVVGSSIWSRAPGAHAWRSVGPPPGAPDQAATAAAVADGEVWVATSDALGEGNASQLHRSTDLTTWSAEPIMVDGAPSTAAVNALAMVDERWVALLDEASSITVAVSPDGRTWESTATIPVGEEPGDRPALFDIGERDGEPVIVGFIPGDLTPVLVDVGFDGSVSEMAIDDPAFEGVRLWGVARLSDGRRVVAGDRVALDAAGEATGFTPTLYEAPDAETLRVLATLPSPGAFAAPSDLVVVGDEIVVVGMVGDQRGALSPAAWSACLPSG